MRLSSAAVRAEVPWGGTQARPEIPQEGKAPRREVAYACTAGHQFTVPFAGDAPEQPGWDCYCGKPARLEGTPEGTEHHPDLPGYSSPGGGKYGRPTTDITPMGQLMKRRSKKQGAAILAEAMARARESGVAR